MEKERIEIYRERVFGDKLNATFDFVRENWRPLVKYATYMMLPLACVLGLTMKSVMTYYMRAIAMRNDSVVDFLVPYALTILFYVIATLVLAGLLYAMMRLYRERRNRLQELTWGELSPTFWRVFRRMLLLSVCFLVVYVLAILVLVLMARLSLWTMLLTVPALIVCAFPMAYWAPAYAFEELSVFAALKKAYRLGFPTWGGILLIAIVLGLLSMVINSVISIPWSIGLVAYIVLSEAGEGSAPIVMDFVLYLLTVVQTYCSLIVSMLTLVGMAFQYGHAADKIDGITMDRNIEQFEQLGDSNVDAPDMAMADDEFNDFDKL